MTETPIQPGSPFETLRQLRRWVGWRWETRKGKRTKPPVAPGTGRYASVSNPRTWGSHEDALAMSGVDGIGFVLTDHPNLAAVDADHCRDAATGALAGWAQALLDQAESYAEITPSAAGLRVVGLAEGLGRTAFQRVQGTERRARRGLLRRRRRFITVSGNVLRDRPLADITPLIRALMAERAGAQNGAQPGPQPGADADLDGLVAEVADLIRNGAPAGADRSVMLFRAVAAMREAGWVRERIISTLRAYPRGIAAKCFDTGRDDVARHVDMILRKIDDDRAARQAQSRQANPQPGAAGATAQTGGAADHRGGRRRAGAGIRRASRRPFHLRPHQRPMAALGQHHLAARQRPICSGLRARPDPRAPARPDPHRGRGRARGAHRPPAGARPHRLEHRPAAARHARRRGRPAHRRAVGARRRLHDQPRDHACARRRRAPRTRCGQASSTRRPAATRSCSATCASAPATGSPATPAAKTSISSTGRAAPARARSCAPSAPSWATTPWPRRSASSWRRSTKPTCASWRAWPTPGW